MSDRKLARAVRTLIRQISRLSRSMTKALMTWLLRLALVSQRRRRYATGGFVLPTTVLLILVVSLTTGALTYRAFSSSTRTIGETQNRVIYNAATPAVDRARAKLDYLFDVEKDPRLPSGVPSGGLLTAMLLNTPVDADGNGAVIGGVKAPGRATTTGKPDGADPYTFPDEGRLDINGDDKADNAWGFRADTDGDGRKDATVVYSLIFSTPANQAALLSLSDQSKAVGDVDKDGKPDKLDPDDTQPVPLVRSGPLSNARASGCGNSSATGKSKVEQGWYQDPNNTSILRKNFQIDALVIPDGKGTPGTAATVPAALSTLELQQDREVSRGNKWGAWFRNDLEIYPGKQFNWNGAMHTEGSLIAGNGNFTAYLVSAPKSCLFYESASEISITKTPEKKPFVGLVLSGQFRTDGEDGAANTIHIHKPAPTTAELNPGSDSTVSGKKPSEISLDPEELQKTNEYKARDGSTNVTSRDSGQVDPAAEILTTFEGRIKLKAEKAPYVDDGYRADNRYGPKQKYNADISIPGGSKVGDPIAGANVLALTSDADSGDGVVGLDGYWERRGRNEGLRILVGQRLELGNPSGWVAPQDRPAAIQDVKSTTIGTGDGDFSDLRTSAYATVSAASAFNANTALVNRPDPDTSDNEGDPLYPPTETLTHEARQRRALRDNLSAVQATAVYHAAVKKDEPIACVATTAHFGSPFAIQQSINFVPTKFNTSTELLVDFFNGRGTNGLEFTPPSVADMTSTTSAMGIALRNLANFAGDPDGAFPPKQEAGKVHPDPYQTMWGNFSNLKRAISLLDTSGYAALSPADKTYLHTAACTLGMLGTNVDTLQKFDPTSTANTTVVAKLGSDLANLMNGVVAANDPEVLPKAQLSTYGYNATGTYNQESYNARDYDRVPAEVFLSKVRDYYMSSAGGSRSADDPHIRMAELILTSMQVRRDRTYGFRPSPAANTWNFNPYVTHDRFSTDPVKKATLWSSACDPNIFTLPSAPASVLGTETQFAPYPDTLPASQRVVENQRLGLSRLCGTVIHSGAVHDFPGDTKYPARDGATTTYLPKNSDDTVMKAPLADKELSFPFEVTPNPEFATNTLLKEIRQDKPYTLAQVAPKWPALYYILPEFEHDHDGGIETLAGTIVADHRQPGNTTDGSATLPKLNLLPAAYQPWNEPYITRVTAPTYTYKPVQTTAATGYLEKRTGYTAPETTFQSGGTDKKLTYATFGGFLPIDRPVSSLVLALGSALPSDTPAGAVDQNTKPNRILTAGGVKVVPFLDRVLFNGREGLPARVLDIDLGMLRRTRPTGQTKNNTDYAPGDVWLPASGLVYAFREDAVREDAINRPASTTLCAGTGKPCTDVRNPNAETDPPVDPEFNVSLKPVDFVPDPDRRSHGFRLRNGTQLRRHKTMVDSGGSEFTNDKNVLGIDLISDNSVYIMGPFNLHQDDDKGSKEDNGDPNDQTNVDRLEEFKERITSDDTPYDYNKFYVDRVTQDDRFADPDKDRWRPAAILADSITILSETFCDGSAQDTFTTVGSDAASATVNASVYKNDATGLYGPGCTANGKTSFLNQNRPKTALGTGWSWARENSDALSAAAVQAPIKVSRNGNGFLTPPSSTVVPTSDAEKATAQKPKVLADYDTGVFSSNEYYAKGESGTQALQDAKSTRVNSILVGGIVPSRALQSYGGMHNFPIFQENWDSKSLWFAGSFLQLSFSNAATAPYDLDATEPGQTPQDAELIPYYQPPNRLWGYDPALLLATAGPIASRFVSTDTTRSEFYSEVAANDPYIKNLCTAAKKATSLSGEAIDLIKFKCPQ